MRDGKNSRRPARRRSFTGQRPGPGRPVEGRLEVHRDGFGFVRPQSDPQDPDIFISPEDLGGAMHGDRVLAELRVAPPYGKRAGRIVKVLTHFNPTVVGVFHYAHGQEGAGHRVDPWDEHILQPIVIPRGMDEPVFTGRLDPDRVYGEALRPPAQSHVDLEGLVVEAEILEWPTETRAARGRVLEVLGAEDDFGVDVEIMIRKHHLPHRFPAEVLEEAERVTRPDRRPSGLYLAGDIPAPGTLHAAGREDFRGLPIVTIDGETAKDFDDAVLVRKRPSGWELQVHIADVAEYVTAGSALDREARLRGTSVYFPDRAVPMLPQALSTGACSLRPDEDRPVLSCIMHITDDGAMEDFRLCEGIIRSFRRMTYTQVHAALEGDPVVREEFASLAGEFDQMYELARLLHARRRQRGSIDFDLPEPVIEFDSLGAMQSIVRSERSWANRLIEEFMLSANECVASWLEQAGVPALYRIHEKPEPRRVVEFEEAAAAFGYSLGLGPLPVRRMTMKAERREHRAGSGRPPRMYEVPEDIPVTPRMYQELAQKIAGKPEERILAHLMLRSLRQARYSEINEGHFALAAERYTHFTSPIRRYPDLVVHRIVKALLHSGASAAPYGEEELESIASESSLAERRAAEAEAELIEWKKLKFMRNRIGEEFDAMILSVTRYGCFIELDNLFIEGLVPIASLEGDRFTYRENTRQIIGERFGKRYSVGDRVRVLLDRLNVAERRLQFAFVEPATSGQPSRRSRATSETKKRKHAKRAEKEKPREQTRKKLKTKKRPGRPRRRH